MSSELCQAQDCLLKQRLQGMSIGDTAIVSGPPSRVMKVTKEMSHVINSSWDWDLSCFHFVFHEISQAFSGMLCLLTELASDGGVLRSVQTAVCSHWGACQKASPQPHPKDSAFDFGFCLLNGTHSPVIPFQVAQRLCAWIGLASQTAAVVCGLCHQYCIAEAGGQSTHSLCFSGYLLCS
jgi:hypothetical protein